MSELKQNLGDLFPDELVRRKWSKKEIATIIYKELGRNGKLKQKLDEIILTAKWGNNKT